MRVLMLTVNSGLMDGVNRHILTVAPALNRREGLEVSVCTVFPAGELNAELQKCGVRTFSLDAPNGHAWKILWRFKKVMAQVKPDIVHAHIRSIFEQIVLSVFYRKVAYLETKHGICVSQFSRPVEQNRLEAFKRRISVFVLRNLRKMFLLPPHVHCYIAKAAKDDFERHGFKEPSFVIYNPIARVETKRNTGKLQSLLGLPADTRVIGTACRIAIVKNPQALASVMCRVMKEMPDVHAAIMGDGPGVLCESMKEVARQYGCLDRFHLMGYRPEAAQLVGDLSFFVMTSREEGMPTALLEAMAVHTPVAFMDGGGGLQDMVEINTKELEFAVVAAQGDEAGLARKIVNALKSPQLMEKLVANMDGVIDRHFELNRVCDQIVEMYDEVLVKS